MDLDREPFIAQLTGVDTASSNHSGAESEGLVTPGIGLAPETLSTSSGSPSPTKGTNSEKSGDLVAQTGEW